MTRAVAFSCFCVAPVRGLLSQGVLRLQPPARPAAPAAAGHVGLNWTKPTFIDIWYSKAYSPQCEHWCPPGWVVWHTGVSLQSPYCVACFFFFTLSPYPPSLLSAPHGSTAPSSAFLLVHSLLSPSFTHRCASRLLFYPSLCSFLGYEGRRLNAVL